MFQSTLSFISLAVPTYLVIRTLYFLHVHTRTPSLARYHPPNTSSWALITGASDGIGFGFAQELAANGFNLILHGRNAEKLRKRIKELEIQYPTLKFRTFIHDVLLDPDLAFANLLKEIKDERIILKILVNNVGGTKGMLSADFKTFAAHTPTEIRSLIATNVTFTTLITNALIPVLTENQPALVMNTGSTSDMGLGYLSVYAATKGFISAFAFGLDMELKTEGVDIEVKTVISGTTVTNQNRVASDWSNPTSRQFARGALQKVGNRGWEKWAERIEGRASVVTGWWMHDFQKRVVDGFRMLPGGEGLLVWASGKILKTMDGKGLSEFKGEIAGVKRE